LETAGFAENTAILFASDHGDMIGERGMWFKKTLFEPAIHVPLILAMPGQSSNRVDVPVSLIDVFPTLLDIAGITAEAIRTPLDGRSLLPGVGGTLEQVPIFAEHIDGGTEAPRVFVRDGAKKLVYSRAYPAQLFDLASDPLELRNLAGTNDPDEERLVQLAEATWPLNTLADDVIASQTARRLVDQALATGRQEVWDFVPRSGARGNFVRRGDDFPEVERRGYLKYSDDA